MSDEISPDSYDANSPSEEWVEGARRLLPVPPEEEEEDGVAEESGACVRTAHPSQKYAELDFTDRRPPPELKNEMADVTYTEVKVL